VTDPSKMGPAPLPPLPRTEGPGSEPARVATLPFQGTEQQLVAGVMARHPGAIAKLFDLYGPQVHRLLYRMLGPDQELDDLVHETFVRALGSIHTLRDASAIRQWMIGVAVFTARIRIQGRSRRWWLRFLPPEELPEEEAAPANLEEREALRCLLRALDLLAADERVALVLHRIEGMTLQDAALAAGTSLATFKRRLARGERKLLALAQGFEALRPWLDQEGGS